MTQEPPKRQDAGMRSLDHYVHRLPKWRFKLRESLIPIVRWETQYVALLQNTFRASTLDSYFALTANLGTHTFFMIILPILFWCGQASLGRAMTQVLASGVFITGFVKDMLCLPRPLSPPLQRISRSSSVALEYGFPSTHSTNAVSVAIYAILTLNQSASEMDYRLYITYTSILSFYALSIVVGRLYCGMHGFFDVVFGSLLGVILAYVQWVFGDAFNTWILEGPFQNVFITALIVLVLVRIHPEPADDCPCFDDSVAFSAVMIGIQLGGWHFARTSYSSDDPIPSTTLFSIEELGWVMVVLRIVLGVVVIFLWRGVMKPSLLKILPPVFRFIEKLGLLLPRKFFLGASQYQSVPPLKKDDTIIPSASEIPAMITSLRYPRRRAISIGPQSQADAYEALAFRERKRRQNSESGVSVSKVNGRNFSEASLDSTKSEDAVDADLNVDKERSGTSNTTESNPSTNGETTENDQVMFSQLQIPRIRYDVEVVTKLIVYTGIAWLATEGNPLLFEICGLGLASKTS